MSPIGQEAALITRLGALKALPRPVYGQLDSPPNLKLGYRHSHPWVQLSHAVEGVLEVRTDNGRFIAPPLRAVWIPAGVTHQVFCAPDTCIRSLYIDRSVAGDAPEHCRVLQVSPLLRELIRHFSTLPEAYAEDGAEGRLVQVLLAGGPLRLLSATSGPCAGFAIFALLRWCPSFIAFRIAARPG